MGLSEPARRAGPDEPALSVLGADRDEATDRRPDRHPDASSATANPDPGRRRRGLVPAGRRVAGGASHGTADRKPATGRTAVLAGPAGTRPGPDRNRGVGNPSDDPRAGEAAADQSGAAADPAASGQFAR